MIYLAEFCLEVIPPDFILAYVIFESGDHFFRKESLLQN